MPDPTARPTAEELGPGIDEHFDDDGDYQLVDCDGDQSDSSESSFGSVLMIGDEKTAQEMKEIVNGIRALYADDGGGGDERDGRGENGIDSDSEKSRSDIANAVDPMEPETDAFYVNALQDAGNRMSEIRLVWPDTLYQCTVDG